MGTDDINILIGSDTGRDDLSLWTQSGLAGTLNATNIAWAQNASSNGSYTYPSSLLRNTPTDFYVWIKGHDTVAPNTNQPARVFLQFVMGEYTYRISMGFSTGANTKNILIEWTGESSGQLSHPNIGNHVWIGLNFVSDGSIDLVYADTRTVPSIAATLTQTWLSGSKLDDIIIGYTNLLVTGNGDIYIEELYIEADTFTVEGGGATLLNIESMTCTKKIGAGGGANIICSFDNDTDLATLADNLRDTVEFYSLLGIVAFFGEIIDHKVDDNTIQFYLEESTKKILSQTTKTEAVVYKGIFRYIDDTIIYDDHAAWTPNDYDGKIMITTDKDLKLLKIFPVDRVTLSMDNTNWPGTINTNIPDNESGHVTDLYFDDPDIVDNISQFNSYSMHFVNELLDPHYSPVLELQYTPYITPSVISGIQEITSAKLKIISRFTSLGKMAVNKSGGIDYAPPLVWIYNWTTTTWDVLFIFDKNNFATTNATDETWEDDNVEAANNFSGKSPILSKEIDIFEELSIIDFDDYISSAGTANPPTNTFKIHNIWIRIKGAQVSSALGDPKMEVHYASLELGFGNNQSQQKSRGLISSNTANIITMDDTTDYTVPDFPSNDGVAFGDEYSITQSMGSLVDSIFSDRTITKQLSIDLAEYGEDDNIKDVTKFEWLNKVSNMLNFTFWDNSNSNTLGLILSDTFTSSGITFTKADIIDYELGNWKLAVSAKQLKDNILIVGFGGQRSEGTVSVVKASSIGAEDKIYRDNEIYSQQNLNVMRTSKSNVHKDYAIYLEFDIDPLLFDYSGLEVGRTAIVNLPALSTTTLFVETLTHRWLPDEGWHETITVILTRRNV